MVFKKTKNARFGHVYPGYTKKSYRLKNGWDVLMLVNNVAVLFNNGEERIVAGAVKKIVEAKDGKFMLVKKDKTKAVYDKEGSKLADFNIQSNLFANGWYTVLDGDDLCLFDENGQQICSHVTKVQVYSDGRYFISVLSGGDATKVGFHEADGSLILFTNDKSFKRLYPSFFIADGSLYDLTGECLIEANQGSTFNRRLVRCLGALPFWSN